MSNLIKKNSSLPEKVKTLHDAEEFQPDAIMLETHAPAFPLNIVWTLILVLLIIMIIGASFSKVDKIVTADGKIVTERPPITMKPLELITVKKVHVHVGDKVKKGSVLFTFDPTINKEQVEQLKDQLRSYKAQADRLRTEIKYNYEVDYKAKDRENKDEVRQENIFLARKNYFKQKLASYKENITKYQKTLDTLEVAMAKYKERKDAITKIENMMETLYKSNASSLKEYLNTKMEVIAMDIQIDQQAISMNESRQAVLSYKAEMESFVYDWQKQMGEELVSAERNITSIESDIPKYQMKLENTEMRAPCDAVVHEIAPYQEGSAVREAEALITLIPIDVKMMAEINIPAKDIGRVKNGDTCKLKFDAFPYQQCGTLDGEIKYISQDAFSNRSQQGANEVTDAGGRLSEASRGVTFLANVEMKGHLKGFAADAPILPGMRIQAEIKVGERSVLNYIMNPFVKALDEAITEP